MAASGRPPEWMQFGFSARWVPLWYGTRRDSPWIPELRITRSVWLAVMRAMAVPFVVAAPGGARVRTRLRVSDTDALVLASRAVQSGRRGSETIDDTRA